MTLKFTDGEVFETQTELHLEKRYDGWYVVGNGMLIPVSSWEEGTRLIKTIKEG